MKHKKYKILPLNANKISVRSKHPHTYTHTYKAKGQIFVCKLSQYLHFHKIIHKTGLITEVPPISICTAIQNVSPFNYKPPENHQQNNKSIPQQRSFLFLTVFLEQPPSYRKFLSIVEYKVFLFPDVRVSCQHDVKSKNFSVHVSQTREFFYIPENNCQNQKINRHITTAYLILRPNSSFVLFLIMSFIAQYLKNFIQWSCLILVEFFIVFLIFMTSILLKIAGHLFCQYV